MICIRICDSKGTARQTKGCINGFVHSLGEDGTSISAAIEARYGDPVFSKLFGKHLRIDRISALADPITYEVITDQAVFEKNEKNKEKHIVSLIYMLHSCVSIYMVAKSLPNLIDVVCREM